MQFLWQAGKKLEVCLIHNCFPKTQISKYYFTHHSLKSEFSLSGHALVADKSRGNLTIAHSYLCKYVISPYVIILSLMQFQSQDMLDMVDTRTTFIKLLCRPFKRDGFSSTYLPSLRKATKQISIIT